jgi:hypothetical protein
MSGVSEGVSNVRGDRHGPDRNQLLVFGEVSQQTEREVTAGGVVVDPGASQHHRHRLSARLAQPRGLEQVRRKVRQSDAAERKGRGLTKTGRESQFRAPLIELQDLTRLRAIREAGGVGGSKGVHLHGCPRKEIVAKPCSDRRARPHRPARITEEDEGAELRLAVEPACKLADVGVGRDRLVRDLRACRTGCRQDEKECWEMKNLCPSP